MTAKFYGILGSVEYTHTHMRSCTLLYIFLSLQIRASATEMFLSQNGLYDAATLSGAMSVLSSEISPNLFPAATSAQYRSNLALNLFYKVRESVTKDRKCD